MNSTATVQSWFSRGYPGAHMVSVPDLLQPCYQLARGALFQAAAPCLQPLGFILIRADAQSQLLAQPWVRPKIFRKTLCSRPPETARRHIVPLQPVWPVAERPFAVHPAAAGEKRRIAYAPNLTLAAPAAGVKKTLGAGHGEPSGQPPHDGASWSRLEPPKPSAVIPEQVCSLAARGPGKPLQPRECRGQAEPALRQHYLGLFTQECLAVFASPQEAAARARAEERAAFEGSASKRGYVKAAVDVLKRLRGLAPSAVPGLDKATLYGRFQSCLLSEEQRWAHGYPFAHPDRAGSAVVHTAKRSHQSGSRICCRCGTQFQVSACGRCLSPEPCFYHFGRLVSRKVAGGWEFRYTCCSGPMDYVGCRVAKQHVRDGRKENLQGFVSTVPKKHRQAHPGIYALDCEMSYTTHGLELTRITVVDTALQVVYDTFVKPENEIVDYNTMFSGVTEADLESTDVRLRDVQAQLLNLFSADTILVGHSLESDLLAVKLIHSAVVDTSVLFPHHSGLPYKRSLRGLAAQYLYQTIQASAHGHSSEEDAGACMQLVIWKIQEDAKTSGDEVNKSSQASSGKEEGAR